MYGITKETKSLPETEIAGQTLLSVTKFFRLPHRRVDITLQKTANMCRILLQSSSDREGKLFHVVLAGLFTRNQLHYHLGRCPKVLSTSCCYGPQVCNETKLRIFQLEHEHENERGNEVTAWRDGWEGYPAGNLVGAEGRESAGAAVVTADPKLHQAAPCGRAAHSCYLNTSLLDNSQPLSNKAVHRTQKEH